MSVSISSLNSRLENLQICSFNQYPMRTMRSYAVDARTVSFCLGPFIGRSSTLESVVSTSVCIFATARGRHDHQNRSPRPAWKQRPSTCKGLASPYNEPPICEGSSMDEIYDALAHRLLTTTTVSEPNEKYIVGLAGPPGSGKSTLANEVVHRLNVLWHQRDSGINHQIEPADIAVVVPMDGFHLYRSQLDMMEDPEEAYARRGAPWTFDPARLLSCLTTLRRQGLVYVPSFDHGIGDPVEDDIFVSPFHKIVLVEGNYLLLEDGLWRELASLFNERWFLEVDIDTAMQRVEKRHISTGKLPGVAKRRIHYNDRPNAELIVKSRKNADLVICSVDIRA